jgi:hypothetical protein
MFESRQSDCFCRGNKQRNKQTPSTTLHFTRQTSQISPKLDIWEQVVVRPTITNQTGHDQTVTNDTRHKQICPDKARRDRLELHQMK